MSVFRDFFVKEKPVFTGITRGVGGFGFGKAAAAAAAAATATATGGAVTQHVNKDGKIYKLHLWNSSTAAPDKEFTVEGDGTLTGDVIVVGAGGAGGNYAGGGGGAGGVLYSASGITINPAASVPVTIGTGGVAGTGAESNGSASTSGGNSSIVINGVTLTANGGGNGSDYPKNSFSAGSGGSGGGGARGPGAGASSNQNPAPTPGGNLTGYGNAGVPGEVNAHPNYCGGGGGGAGGQGQPPGTATNAGPGGVGGQFTRFSRAYLPPSAGPGRFLSAAGGGGLYAAGGGGGVEGTQYAGAGGVGGGGIGGGPGTGQPGQSGFGFGAGGGGGAGAYPYPEAKGGNGADGVVMVRYETGNRIATTTGATATGGNYTTTPGNGYKYHTFTSDGPLNFSQGGEIEVLIVAGGGSSASSSACCVGHGGGGGGGILHGGYTIGTGDFPIVVGPGGAAGNNNGGDSTFDGHTAKGGGYGGNYSGSWNEGADGGCGGGGMSNPGNSQGEVSLSAPRKGSASLSTQNPSPTPGIALSGYGSEGGQAPGRSAGSPQESMVGGGGGGAGGAGHKGTPGPYRSEANSRDGNGGIGVQFPQFEGSLIGVPALSPLNGYFGGGGGGGVRNNYPDTGTAGAGGTGGGGAGGTKGSDGTAGTANSGGGAGGPSGGYSGNGTAGGSGIVVIRYKV